jgi:steroid delta-isomerase-like uncharacterized protein
MTEEYPTLVHRWMEEVWNKKRESAIDEMLAPDGVTHGLLDADGNALRGPDGFKGLHRSFIDAIPDLKVDINDSVSEGNKTWARIRVTGTHTGDGLGVVPTDQPVDFTGMVTIREEDGKIAEAWNEIDFAKMNSQIQASSTKSGGYQTFLHRWFEEVWNQGREETINELVADDVIAHGLTDQNGDNVVGKEDFRMFFRNFRSAFSDINVEVGEVMQDGDKMSALTRVRATHGGDGLGFCATNNAVDFSGILMVRLRDGQIAEAWNYYDFVSMFGQLGVLAINPPSPMDQSHIA